MNTNPLKRDWYSVINIMTVTVIMCFIQTCYYLLIHVPNLGVFSCYQSGMGTITWIAWKGDFILFGDGEGQLSVWDLKNKTQR